MLIPLTRGDDLPLRLGEKVKPPVLVPPTPIEPPNGAWWMCMSSDPAVQPSDLQHPSAPKIKTTVTFTQAEVITATPDEVERAVDRFFDLPYDEQNQTLLPREGRAEAHRPRGDIYDYRPTCGCMECEVIRDLVRRERRGDFAPVTATLPKTIEPFPASPMLSRLSALLEMQKYIEKQMMENLYLTDGPQLVVSVDPGSPEGVKVNRVRVEAIKQREHAAAMSMMPQGYTPGGTCALKVCPGCGVEKGAKHFLSCYIARPSLLDDNRA